MNAADCEPKSKSTTTTMSLFSPSITSSSGGASTFTINSFTQNLASVLSDTRRSKSEVAAFFTRHWGEQFVPRQNVPPAPTIPTITLEHFRHYLGTTARKHRQYIRARRALRRGGTASQRRQQEKQASEQAVSKDEIPDIFFSPTYQNRDLTTFESVFLEPKAGDPDKLVSQAERRRLAAEAQNPQPIGRHGSCGSLTSMLSLQQPSMPVEASGGRLFRACQRLQQRLEFYDDAINALVNQQLESKNEQFWRTIHSYGAIHSDLEETIERVKLIRQKLAKSKVELCQRTQRLLQLHYAHLNREKLLARLQEIACLRDAQSTVQMLLNQEDVGRALECIETAHEVLSSELRGVKCFRHMGSQLEEMTRSIGIMLFEEFIAKLQRQFAWPIDGGDDNKADERNIENQLEPIVSSLIRCSDFRFLTVLREEIVGTIKNITKQVVKTQLMECLDSTTTMMGFNPATLSEHLVKLTDAQWAQTLRAVLLAMAIQNLVIKCAEQAIQQKGAEGVQSRTQTPQSPSEKSERSFPKLPATKTTTSHARRRPSINSTTSAPPPRTAANGTSITGRQAKSEFGWPISSKEADQSDEEEPENPQESADKIDGILTAKLAQSKSPPPASTSLLAMPCHDVQRLRAAVQLLVGHAVLACEERVAKLVQSRFKDHLLARCSPMAFNETGQIVTEFIQKCQALTSAIASEQPAMQSRSPIQTVFQQLTTKFLSKFTESRQQQFNDAIVAEMWKPASVPVGVQKMVDRYTREGKLSSDAADDRVENGTDNENREVLLVRDEPFVVTSSVCLLIRLLAEYNDLLRLFPTAAMELAMDVVQCLKQFNSRTCQLILGAGARQLVGLKTITVKHLALASRCLQLVARFIPSLREAFAEQLPPEKHQLLRHFDSTARDYADHVGEIRAKLLAMMDKELIGALEEWKLEGKVPTPSFQQIVMQIGKFYSSYSAIMPPALTTEMLHLIHANFKLYFKQHLQSRGITPHDSLAYGMAGQDFAYYVENVRALPDCQSFPNDTIGDVLKK